MQRSASTTEHFDERLYLEQNPDVREAVRVGRLLSGFEHYILVGRRENRPGMPPDACAAAEQYIGHTAPPASLRLRVHGDDVLLNFITFGQVATGNILRSLPPDAGLDPDSRVLDFGCGCGRVISLLSKSLPGHIFGTDIDKEAIGWCRHNLSHLATFSCNVAWPPLGYADGHFDFIYSISIFTHLPEDMQTAWLQELGRVIKPGRYALITVHGEELFPAEHLAKSEIDKFADAGFYYHIGEATDGLPAFYRTTIHSERYIRTHWSKFFDIQRIIKRGVNNHQDIVVCRKRT